MALRANMQKKTPHDKNVKLAAMTRKAHSGDMLSTVLPVRCWQDTGSQGQFPKANQQHVITSAPAQPTPTTPLVPADDLMAACSASCMKQTRCHEDQPEQQGLIHDSTLRMIPVSSIGRHHMIAITPTVKSHECPHFILKKKAGNKMPV